MKTKLSVCVVMMTICLSVCAYARTYKIGTAAWIGWSPVNVADAKGFFKEEGLDVKVFSFSDGPELRSVFKNKRIDLAFETIGNMVELYMQGISVTIIAETDWSNGGDKIILRKDKDPAALKGKPIGVYDNTPAVTYFLNQYFMSIGVKLSDIRPVEMKMKTLTNNFIEGRFDLIVAYDPEALRAEREGGGKVAATTATYPGVMPEGMMALTDVLKDIPKADLAKILKAWIKAVQWCHDPANINEYMKILNSHTFKGTPPHSQADLKQMMSEVRIHDVKTLSEQNKTGGGLHVYLENLKAFLSSNNLLKKDFKPSEISDNTVITDILKE